MQIRVKKPSILSQIEFREYAPLSPRPCALKVNQFEKIARIFENHGFIYLNGI